MFKSEVEYNKFEEMRAANNDGNRTKEQLIANFVYGDRLGNKKNIDGEGWRFKGRGLCQVTGRTNHTNAYQYISDHPDFKGLQLSIPEEADKVVALLGQSPYLITAFSMAHWKHIVLNHFSNMAENTDEISGLIGVNVAWEEKKKVFEQETSKLFKTKDCTFTYFPDYGDGVLEMMKRYVKKGWTYNQSSDRISLKYRDIKEVDCSELVCIYLHLLGITEKVAVVTTADMVSEEAFLNNGSFKKLVKEGCSLEHVDGKDGIFDPNFIPERGDIFVWRRDKADGHTGIVYDYDRGTKKVTILEAIHKEGSQDDDYYIQQLKIMGEIRVKTELNINVKNKSNIIAADLSGKTRIAFYQLHGAALEKHDKKRNSTTKNWKGYFRPKGYKNKL